MSEQKYYERHPYLFVAFLGMIVIIVALLVGTIVKKLGLPDYTLYAGTMMILATIIVLILQKIKWWETIGFRRFDKKYITLLITPAIPMIGNLFGNYKSLELRFYIYYLLLTIMTGFVEEGIYRGLMLRTLLQRGVWKAVIITSLIFSVSHIMNALAGWDWQHVVLQLCYAFAIGFGWAAFALQTGTIWPLMLIHFLTDFFSFIKTENLIKSLQESKPSLEEIIYSLTLSIVFIIYGIIVTRSYVGLRSKDRIIWQIGNYAKRIH